MPKTVNLPDERSFILRYRRATRNELPANVTIKKTYKQRAAPTNKRRRIRGSFIKKLMKHSTVRKLGKAALKELPTVYGKVLQKLANKNLR